MNTKARIAGILAIALVIIVAGGFAITSRYPGESVVGGFLGIALALSVVAATLVAVDRVRYPRR